MNNDAFLPGQITEYFLTLPGALCPPSMKMINRELLFISSKKITYELPKKNPGAQTLSTKLPLEHRIAIWDR